MDRKSSSVHTYIDNAIRQAFFCRPFVDDASLLLHRLHHRCSVLESILVELLETEAVFFNLRQGAQRPVGLIDGRLTIKT